MKKFLICCLVAVMGIGVCAAQTDKKEAGKTCTTVFSADIDCAHCAKKIMDNVPSLGKGVKDVQVNVASKQVTVTYDAAKNNDETIVKGLATLKVKAEPLKAEFQSAELQKAEPLKAEVQKIERQENAK